jgi:hypothetical protein
LAHAEHCSPLVEACIASYAARTNELAFRAASLDIRLVAVA